MQIRVNTLFTSESGFDKREEHLRLNRGMCCYVNRATDGLDFVRGYVLRLVWHLCNEHRPNTLVFSGFIG